MHTEQWRGHPRLSLGLVLVVLSLTLPGQAQEGARRVPLSTPQRTALVIGNSQYSTGPLRNPVNDAKDMADVLKRVGFAVTLLTDVTQAQMETAVITLSQQLRYGGVGLFYFAGHGMQLDGQNYLWPVGTSMTTPADVRYKAVQASWVQARMEEAGNTLNILILDACRDAPFTRGADPELGLDIAPSSGALVPADARVYVTDAARTVAGLIVGKDDLRRRFTALERERQILVIIDACYSGNTVRSLRGGAGIARYLPLAFTRSITRNLPALPDYKPAFTSTPKLPSPYANLIYISASDETELARDLPSEQTVDKLAHGALTNELLIGLRGAADTNHDGRLTYQELYQFLRREVYKHGHTPQLLAQTDLERPLFDVATRLTAPVTGAPPAVGPLRVKLEGQNSTSLRDTLARLASVSLTEASYDILVTSAGRGYTLVLPNGDTLCSVDTVKDVAARLTRYMRVRELLSLTNPQQQFNVRLQVGEYAGKTVFVEGEAVDFTIEVERAAAVLLVSVDPHGGLTALTSRVIPESRLLLQSAGKVEPPLGTEYFKLFAFTQPLLGLDQFTNRALDPAGSEISELLRLIKSTSDWAETLREIVTVKRP